MLNLFSLWRKRTALIPCFVVGLMLCPPLHFSAIAAKYKKSTVIDFEGALVEGKSRKPYSAYLTQQKDSAFGELHQWQPDLDKRLQDARTRLDRSP
ncbi:MAG TPA: hypothetical protein VIH99_08415 [Bdellovibrionota bacterium]